MATNKAIFVRIYPSRDCVDTMVSRSVKFNILDSELAKYTDCKENFVLLLQEKCAPFSGNPDAIVIKRKLKKHRNYVDLESKDDFRLLVRSLEVKNVAKLVICAKLPTRPPMAEHYKETTLPVPCCNGRKRSRESIAKLFIVEMGGLLLQTAVQHFSEAADPFSGMGIDLGNAENIKEEQAKYQAKALAKAQNVTEHGVQTTEIAQNGDYVCPAAQNSTLEVLDHSVASLLSKIDRVIHKDIVCDNCDDNKSIVGVRFKCLDCLNFDLCGACEAKGVELLNHKNTHTMNKYVLPRDAWLRGVPDLSKYEYMLLGGEKPEKQPSRASEEHPGILCDLCDNNKYIKGVRHKCMVCANFDLCDMCAEKDVELFDHKKWHAMARIVHPGAANGTNSFLHKSQVPLRTTAFNDEVKMLETLKFKAKRYDEFHALFDESLNEEEKDDLIKAFISLSSTKLPEVIQEDLAEAIVEECVGNSVEKTLPIADDQIQIRILKSSTGHLQFSLANNSNFTIGGQDILKFEFIDEKSRKCIDVLCHKIAPGRSRAFNFSFKHEKLTLNSIFDKTLLRISTGQQAFEGKFTSNVSVLMLSHSKDQRGLKDKAQGEDYPSKIKASFSIKSEKLSQISIKNESDVNIICDATTFQIVNCFGLSIAHTTMKSKRTIKPGRSEKFNINVNSAHLKFPFTVKMRNAQVMGQVSLSLKNLEGEMQTERVNQTTEDLTQPLIELSTNLKVSDETNDPNGSFAEESAESTEKVHIRASGIKQLENRSDSETDIEIEMESDDANSSDDPDRTNESVNPFEEFKLSDKSGSNSSMIIPVLRDMSLSASEYLDAKSMIVEDKAGITVASEEDNIVEAKEEAKEEANGVASMETADETIEGDANEADEYDIVSSDMDEEFGSDYEVLSPMTSHDGQV